jgi:NAD(P)-dependent dehydrogenase (short-subunit alcohol dehydrogenase family)
MGRSVVVTGAASGIGRATALDLAAHGFDVIATARTAEKAATLDAEAGRRHLRLRTVTLDVADAESCVRAFTHIAAMTDGGPWAVVNNAEIALPGAVEHVDDDDARLQLEVNLLAPARIARLVLPAMRQRRDGRIINISSLGGRVTTPFLGWYCASKQGLEALTDALRIEVARFGVRVVLVEPGALGAGGWQRGVPTVPNRDRSPYRDLHEPTDGAVRRVPTLADPVPVARTVRHALLTRHPRARYLVGTEAHTGALFDALTPTVVSDYTKELLAGLRTPPRQVRRFMGR